jgi:hypothetical protein
MSFEKFDALMIELIKSGQAVTASALTTALEADAKPFVTIAGEEFRVIDRRLQALRKKKVIECTRQGRFTVWKLIAQ